MGSAAAVARDRAVRATLGAAAAVARVRATRGSAAAVARDQATRRSATSRWPLIVRSVTLTAGWCGAAQTPEARLPLWPVRRSSICERGSSTECSGGLSVRPP
eukprot:scaffold96076_cov63-Phaeocystis_antarctica.AAC.1